MALTRTNVTIPEDLLQKVDAIAGPRGRSRYVAEAIEQRVKRDWLRIAIENAAGSLVPKGGRPMTREEVSAWVSELRDEVSD